MKKIIPPTLQESCQIAARKHGGDAVKAVLAKFSPTGKAADVPPALISACVAALRDLDKGDSDPGYDTVYIPEPPADDPEPEAWQVQEHVGAGNRNLPAEPKPTPQPPVENPAARDSEGLVPDLEMAGRFVEALTGARDTEITTQTFDDSGAKRGNLVGIMHGTLAELAPKLTELNRRGAGIFICVNPTDLLGRKAANIIGVRAVWGDFDGTDALALALAAAEKLPPSIEVESSPGKRHEYWLTDGITIAGFRPLNNALAAAIGSDRGATSIERVLRIPGFWHRKGDQVQVKLLATHPERRYTAEQITTAFGLDTVPATDAKPQERAAFDALAYVLNERKIADLRAALKHLDATKRDVWFAVCAALCRSGEAGFKLFHEWAATAPTNGKHGYQGEDDCRAKFDETTPDAKSGPGAIFTMAQAAGWSNTSAEVAAAIWDFKPLNMALVMREKPNPIKWLFNQRVPGNRGALLTGLGGTSKTQMLYQMAIAAILGNCPWGWQVDTTGKAVLILTEDDENDPHITIHVIKTAMGLTSEHNRLVEENLTVFPLAGKDVKLMVRDQKSGSLIESDQFRGFEQLVKDIGGVVFIGIDPALGVTEGDEASQSDQRALGRMADNLAVRCNCSVFILTHGTKGSLQSDEINSHSSRGGGAITDAVRAEYGMRTMTTKEAEKFGVTDIAERESYVQLKNTKGNRIPPEAKVPVWFHRGRGGYLESIKLVEVQRGGISPQTKRMLDVMVEMDPDNNGLRLQDWRHRCIEKGLIVGLSDEARKKAMNRALKSAGANVKKKDGERGVYQRNFASYDNDADDDHEDAA